MEAAIASDGKVTVQATGRIVAVSENIPPAARNSQTNRIPVRSSGLLFLRAPRDPFLLDPSLLTAAAAKRAPEKTETTGSSKTGRSASGSIPTSG